MSQLDYLEGCVLGLVQGLTEFLPVSSSSHLIVFQKLFGLKGDSPETLLFDVASHVGTLASVVVIFAGTFAKYFRQLVVELLPKFGRRRRPAWMITMYGVAASVPTAAIGLGFKDYLESTFDSLDTTAVGLLMTAAMLFLIGRIPRPRLGWRRFGPWKAALVGVAQGIAISPGISRSGSTICTALLLGFKRRWAAEFSFFILTPAIIGAAFLKTRDALKLPPEQFDAVAWGPIIAGTIVSFVSGCLSLRLVVTLVVRDKLHYFWYYCAALGCALLVWARLA